MQTNINLDQFIKEYVTKRPESLLKPDFEKYHTELSHRINGKKVLVIGEAPNGCERYDCYVLRPRVHLMQQLKERAKQNKPDDKSLLMYTSGSTGKPKGVVQTHRSILANVAVQIEHLYMDGDMRCLMHFPINHVAAAVEIGYACIYAGGASIMMDRFEPLETLHIVERERVTMFGQVPAMFLMQFGLPQFKQTDFSSVRVYAWGAMGWLDQYGPQAAQYLAFALTVGFSLVGVVIFGTMAGAMLPFVLRRLGADPASASAPFVATLVDVTGLIIYFLLAGLFL